LDYIVVEFAKSPVVSYLIDEDDSLNDDDNVQLEHKLCETYVKYGYCNQIDVCDQVHDTKLTVKIENYKNQRKKNDQVKSDLKPIKQRMPSGIVSCGHQAGTDAFMTGYIFISFLKNFNKTVVTNLSADVAELKKISNNSWSFNIYLTGKDYPLIINKSSFVHSSLNHSEKFSRINF
jgi:hypothetical protein